MSSHTDKLTVEQKFAKAMLELRILRPFYSAVYEVMEKRKSDSFESVGVGIDYLVYNEKFVDKLEFSEFLFVLLHEVAHIALMHVARRESRDPLLWNIACDFYVNALLAEEFRLDKLSSKTSIEGITIKMPRNILKCNSIDLDEDCVEDMYDNLYDQAKQNGYESAMNGGQPGDGEVTGQNSEPGTGKKFKFTMQGSKNTGKGKPDSVDIEVAINEKLDLIDDGEDQTEKNQKSNKITTDAAVRVDMSGTGVGSTPGLLESKARKLLNSEIDWKRLLKKYLIAATSRDSSFNKPDKRMYYQKSIYPGLVSEDSDEVHGIKVCIDTSGSISDEDLGHFMGQVWHLCKTYKVKAELIYWDAAIESTGEFTGYKEFERVNIYGRGGTNPAVVFDYLDSKKCKVKPIVTLIFTDGYFGEEYNKPSYRKKFKDTIWIMNKSHNKDFKPAFGKLTVAKFKN